jgi:hypothetical protein
MNDSYSLKNTFRVQSMKYILIVSIILGLSMESYGQRWKRDRKHLVFGLGAAGFMGDLGGADEIGTEGMKDFDFAAIRPAMTAGYQYLLLEYLSVTGNISFGYISGNDVHTNEPFRNNRNIHFRSPLLELSAQSQFYFFDATREGARYRRTTRTGARRRLELKLYGFAGVGGFYFNPQSYFDASAYRGSIPAEDLPANGWYNLRPLNTEGQGYFPTRNKYSRVSVSIPFGLGATLRLSREIAIGLEYGLRKTFTDYMDDVSTTYVDPRVFSEIFDDPKKIALAEYFANPTINSLSERVTAPGQQRGNPFNTDAYMFAFVTLYYRLSPTRPGFGLPRF